MPKKTLPGAGLLTAALLTLSLHPAAAQQSEAWRAMNQPVEPFRILGNLYYVGANSVAIYLITTPEGHILIDGGFEETVPIIRSGIAELGFELKDVKILLNSHAHIDHAAGLAALKKETGAKLFASKEDSPVLEKGGLGDDLFGDRFPFPAVEVDRRLEDGDTVELGGVTLTARVTAGHTRGCTSWVFDVEHEGKSHKAVSICSLSALEGMQYRTQTPTYPGIADDFRRSFEVLESIPAEIFLASHATFFQLGRKRQRLGEDGPNPFIDPAGYRRYISRARERFQKAVTEEEASARPL